MLDLRAEKKLDELVSLVSEPKYKAMLIKLCRQGAMRVSELAKIYGLSTSALIDVLNVFEKFELVQQKTLGTHRWVEANVEQIKSLATLLQGISSGWSSNVARLAKLIETELSFH